MPGGHKVGVRIRSGPPQHLVVPDIGRPQDAGPAGIDPNLRGSFRIIPRPRESTAMVEPSLWTFAGRSQPCHGFAEPGGFEYGSAPDDTSGYARLRRVGGSG